jgi:hypothetical protein
VFPGLMGIHGEEIQMFTALIIIILLAVIWILLKLLGFAIKLPFKILGFIFKQPFSTIFWLVVVGYVVYYFFIH